MPKKNESQHVFEGFVKEVGGVQGLKVVKALGGEGCTDEKIEKASGIKLATIRSILNNLNYYGIVEYTREKNMQSGWFTYTWKVNRSRAMQNFLVRKKTEFEQLRKQFNGGEGTAIYCCPKGCQKHAFEKAMDLSFKCEKCSAKLEHTDASKELGELEQRINALEHLVQLPRVI